MFSNELSALILTIIAGLATLIGGFIGITSKKFSTRLMAACLGFSAGVMIFVSMVQMFPKAEELICDVFGETNGYIYTVIAFFVGIAFIGLIDYMIPNSENDIGASTKIGNTSLKRLGIITTLTIIIHNFPEGITTFTATLRDVNLGCAICVALALHNVGEGITTSMPLYLATKNKKKTILICLFTGLTEPLGAIIGYLFLRPYLNDAVFGILFAIISGIMIFIALEELIPLAHECEKSKITIIGVIVGMALMALSLIPL